jgi:phosphoserine phosphatase RsbU/P
MTNDHGRLLVADDEQISCSDLATQLGTLGYEVECVHTGDDVAPILEHSPRFDLLLLDTNLPGTDTCSVLTFVRGQPRFHDLPVIVVSTDLDGDRITECMECGADDYVMQPFEPSLLQARIRIVTERRRLQKEQDEDCARAQRLADELQSVILPVGIALSAETDFDRLLERILIEAKTVANADAGTLYLRTDEDKLKFAIMLTDSLGVALGGTTGKEIPFPPLPMYLPDGKPNMHNVASSVALTGRSVKLADVYEAQDFDFSATKKFDQANNYRTRSVLTVPLKNNKEYVIGVLQLINSLDPISGDVNPFDYYEQLVIETLASQAAVALNNQLVFKRQTELLKLERDVQVGHNIQADFLPKNDEMPSVSGWEIVTCLHPARQVAGDFYDAFDMTHGRIGFLIADVCDKGVGAALFMALMRSLTRAFAQQHYSTDLMHMLEDVKPGRKGKNASDLVSLPSVGSLALERAVQLTNDYVAENHGSLAMFATMFFGVLNPTTGHVLYINGGHNAPMIIDAQGHVKTRLQPTGPAVGIFAGAKFEIQRTRLEPGETMVCFTDGVPDARNPEGKLFNEQRIVDLLLDPPDNAAALLKRIEDQLFTYIGEAVQYDDVTLMLVRRSPDSE